MKILDQAFADAQILIVDDTQANVDLLRMILQSAGYQNITCMTDSRQVLDLCATISFDLILLDIAMPHVDGFAIMEQLAKLYDQDYLPILVLTADRNREVRIKALNSGAKDFASKPFDMVEILSRIRILLDARTLHNALKQQMETLERRVDERTRELQLRNTELEQTRQEIIQRLARAGEYRDNETGQHVSRMSHTSYQLAKAYGLDDKTCTLILQASPLHDIGKIGIRDDILLKSGRLDEQEWAVMKTHVECGVELLSGHSSDLMQMACTIAEFHHEKWDGSGYPKGSKGHSIPIAARICALCDVFDALISARPYKEPWPIEKAVAYVNDQSGQHFDPDVVRLFNHLLPELLAINQRYCDAKSV